MNNATRAKVSLAREEAIAAGYYVLKNAYGLWYVGKGGLYGLPPSLTNYDTRGEAWIAAAAYARQEETSP